MVKYFILIILLFLLPVLLKAQLNVDFTFTPNNACSGELIQFTSEVSGGTPPYIYSWDFGDGPPLGTAADPNHVFDAFGCGNITFTVELTVTDTSNGGNISDSYSSNVTVKERPNPQLTDGYNFPYFNNCDSAYVDWQIQVQNITEDTDCITSYDLDWGDASTVLTGLTNSSFPIDHTYETLGAFDLTITAYGENGCIGETIYVAKNQNNPAVGISSDGNTQGKCVPITYPFTLTKWELNSPGTTYEFNFGDGTQTVIWTQEECEDNVGIISHTFEKSSCGESNNEFIVSVLASNACDYTSGTVGGVKTLSRPFADFDVPDVRCVNETICFDNNTNPGYGSSCDTTTTYLWDFGDDNGSSDVNPCHIYSAVGSYLVTLIASNSKCGDSIISKEITVQDQPIANAVLIDTNNTDCVPYTVTFDNSSTGIDIEYSWGILPTSGWEFIGGTDASSEEPIIVFIAAGDYTVTLTVSNACDPDTQSFNIVVTDVPYIDFPIVDGGCVEYIYNCDAVSYVDNGSDISSYSWETNPTNGVSINFPDSAYPIITFSDTGWFQISINAENWCDDSVVSSNLFHVIDFLQVDAGNDISVCLNSVIQLSGDPPGETWSGNNVTPDGLFSANSVGKDTLKYFRGTGSCYSEDFIVITVEDLPLPPMASPDTSICNNSNPIQLSGMPIGGEWSGPGIINGSLFDPDSVVVGDYIVYYTITDPITGCSNFDSITIEVRGKATSDFQLVKDWDCTPVEVTYINETEDWPGTFDYVWDLDIHGTSTDFQPPNAVYTTGANSTVYSISLSTDNGCDFDTVWQELLVKPNPVEAFFSVDKFTGCEDDTFYFYNFSSDTSGAGISNIAWDFGDGNGSSDVNPSHSYSTSGTYVVKLRVDNGCGYDEMVDTIYVNPAPQITLSIYGEACVGETLLFEYNSDVEIAGNTWYFGDGDSSKLASPAHAYLQEGIYEVVLTGTSAFGFPACDGVASKIMEVKPAPEGYILPDTSGCPPLEVTFEGDSGSYHLWNFGENETFTSNPTYTFVNSGLFNVTLISENNSLCKDTSNIEINVLPKPASGFEFTSSGGYPEELIFINTSTGETECIWDFGNGLELFTCEVNDPIEYKGTGEFEIILVTKNQYECYDTATKTYEISYKGLFVPNAFSPEHPDPGVNLFLPKGVGIVEYTIQVFDTWGNIIWQSSALENSEPLDGWDGNNENGDPFPQDVYVWKVYAKFADGTNWSGEDGKTHGTVTLIR